MKKKVNRLITCFRVGLKCDSREGSVEDVYYTEGFAEGQRVKRDMGLYECLQCYKIIIRDDFNYCPICGGPQ
jgi:rubrerythrin